MRTLSHFPEDCGRNLDQIVAPQPVIVHPAAVYLEGCRVVMLFLVEECGALYSEQSRSLGQKNLSTAD
ncbi:hypothetical protein INR49_014249 [Caranx melampygus]|nr:hypothetical protein INR49_014249 [Caranx melampygus]